jgi:hypothetical protein
MLSKKFLIKIISIFVGFFSIGTAFTSAIATASSSYQLSNIIEDYSSCSTCSSDCCTNCSEAVKFVTEYAWEHMPPFPKMKWFHAYPIVKFVSDITLWAAEFAVELQNGFKVTCYQPVFIIAEVVVAATQYALKEVMKIINDILFIFFPAILAIAFIKAVFYYLKQLCNGTNPPDQDVSDKYINSPGFSLIKFALQKINQYTTTHSLFFHNVTLFEI